MKNLLTAFLLCFTTTALAQDATETDPLLFETPSGWTVTYQNPGGAEIYTFNHKDPFPMKVLMLSRWPAGGGNDQIPGYMETLAQSFLSQVEEMKIIQLKTTQYAVKEIAGDTYSGQYVGFVMDLPVDTPQVQTMFMISDGNGIWNGQFTGPIENWKEILAMLKTVKNRAP